MRIGQAIGGALKWFNNQFPVEDLEPYHRSEETTVSDDEPRTRWRLAYNKPEIDLAEVHIHPYEENDESIFEIDLYLWECAVLRAISAWDFPSLLSQQVGQTDLREVFNAYTYLRLCVVTGKVLDPYETCYFMQWTTGVATYSASTKSENVYFTLNDTKIAAMSEVYTRAPQRIRHMIDDVVSAFTETFYNMGAPNNESDESSPQGAQDDEQEMDFCWWAPV